MPKTLEVDDLDSYFDLLGEQIESAPIDEAFADAEAVFRGEFKSNYDRGGSALGAWPPHSPVTVARHGPHPLLILSGAMMQSTIVATAPGHVFQIQTRAFGTGVDKSVIPYAGVQQFGFGRVPPRPYLVASEAAVEEAAEIVGEALTRIVAGVEV